MTVDELKTLMLKGEHDQVLPALEGVPPGEYSVLIKATFQLLKDKYNEEGGKSVFRYTPEYAGLELCGWLVIHRLGSWTDIQKLHKSHYYNPNGEKFGQLFEILFPVLERVRPDWLDKWAEFILDGRGYVDWMWIHRMMKAGLIGRPATDSYLLLMPRNPEFLRANPELLENEIFDLFRVLPRTHKQLFWEDVDPDTGEKYDESKYHGGSFPLSWSLGRLAKEGLVERMRLLTASLEALQMGRHPNDAAWFYQFHEFLAPTVDERAALQRTYCDLLTTDVSTVINFALQAISELSKAGRLEPAHFFSSTDRVFGMKNKGTATAVLKQLEQIAKSDSSLKVDVAIAAAAGLGHESPDVQQAALKTLEGFKLASDERVANQIQSRIESVAASLKERAQTLLDKLSGGTTGAKAKSAPPPPAAAPAHVASAPPPNAVSRIASEQQISPIATLDEFLIEVSAAIENFRHAEDFERLLDAMSRLCDQRPADLEARKKPLIKRVGKLIESELIATEVSLQGRLLHAILVWDEGEPGPRVAATDVNGVEPPPAAPEIAEDLTAEDVDKTKNFKRNSFASFTKRLKGAPVLTFLDGRLEELNGRLAKCDARPLLATPTHPGGWIVASEFVERLKVLEAAGLDPQSFDLRQALLRLAPEGRDDALQRATGLTGSRQDAIEWALGQRRPKTGLEAPIYIAAKAGLDPFAPILVSENPTVLEPLTWHWKTTRAAYGGNTEQQRWVLTVTTSPECFTNPLFRCPPLTLCPIAHHAGKSYFPEGKAKLLAEIWPGNLAPFCAAGAVAIVSELETTSNDSKYLTEFLGPLFDSHTAFSEMAQLLLASALLAKSTDIRGLAVDALISVTEDGRCLGPELGSVLRRMLPSGMNRPNRLAASLQTAARSSPRHMLMSVLAVQSMFSELDAIPDDAHHLLTPLVDWLAELGRPIEEAFRAELAKVGGGKTAKLAKTLLK